jgi:hypothetical protein
LYVLSCFGSDSLIASNRFWRVGMKLFKGKFLRFMSGLKNKGQVSNYIYDLGICRSSDSKVNFAVPSRQILDGKTLKDCRAVENCWAP